MRSLILCFIAGLSSLLGCHPSLQPAAGFTPHKAGNKVYLVSQADPSPEWPAATKSLKAALEAANSNGPAEIWLAQGKYEFPNDINLYGLKNLKIHGGFKGTEKQFPQENQRPKDSAEKTVVTGGEAVGTSFRDGLELDNFTFVNGPRLSSANKATLAINNMVFKDFRHSIISGFGEASITNSVFKDNILEGSPLITSLIMIDGNAQIHGVRFENNLLVNIKLARDKDDLTALLTTYGSSIEIQDSTFHGNSASRLIWTQYGKLSVSNCIFQKNSLKSAAIIGGEMRISRSQFLGNEPLQLRNDDLFFIANTGINANGLLLLTNSVFANNRNGDSAFVIGRDVKVVNCSFYGNDSKESSKTRTKWLISTERPLEIINSIIWKNQEEQRATCLRSNLACAKLNIDTKGGGFLSGLFGGNKEAQEQAQESKQICEKDCSNVKFFQVDAVHESPVKIAHSNLDFEGDKIFEGTGNINADPLFVDPKNGDLHLRYGSPSIGTGLNSDSAPENIKGEKRVLDHFNMGAY